MLRERSSGASHLRPAFRSCSSALSGAYMLTKLDAWNRFQYASFWWLDLMVAVWMLFALMVYVLEPLVIHRLFQEFALRNKDSAFAVAIEFHALALIISAFAIELTYLARTAVCLEEYCSETIIKLLSRDRPLIKIVVACC